MSTPEEVCDAQHWPRPVPNVNGQLMGQALDGSLFCFNFAKATAADGHDVLQDIVSRAPEYRITGVSPDAGKSVGRAEAVTVSVVPVPASEPPAFAPCGWVTTAEAAAFMGAPSVTTMSVGDRAGSVDQMCDYTTSDHMVISELQLPGSFPVDAGSEFSMTVAGGAGSDVAGLPGRAYCSPSTPGSTDSPAMLVVLLSGDRLYRATDDNCDVLKQFAQAAIPRIGD